MPNINLGDFVTLKNHAYQANLTKILIGADATFTPPIMVVCETLSLDNVESTDVGNEHTSQVKAIFYSHRTHKYEMYWFKVEEVKLITSNINPVGNDITIQESTLDELKSLFFSKLVILKSIELELGKNKLSQELRSFDNLIFKKNSHLDFVPPVMTVLDVRINEKLKGGLQNSKSKTRRTLGKFEFKCKYYNPISTTYSEEWLPVDCLIDVTGNFELQDASNLLDQCFIFPLEAPMQFEDCDKIQISTLIRFKKIVYHHYKYVFIGEDLWTPRKIKVSVNEAMALKKISLERMLEKRVPNKDRHYPLDRSDFKINGLYEISYLSDKAISTSRFIYIIDKYTIRSEHENEYMIVANCLLRNGQVRNFKMSNIKSFRKVKTDKKKYFIQKVSKTKK